MPGVWEMVGNPRVLVGILHTEITTITWAISLRMLQFNGNIMPVAGLPFDHARNLMAQKCVESGYDYLFFLDSDVCPPPDCIQKLISHQQPIISGLYCRRSPPHGVPVMQKNRNWVTQYRHGDILDVDVVGTGCLLIHRSVFENLVQKGPLREGKQWFSWQSDLQSLVPPGQATSEDFAFCIYARKHGYKVLVDTSIVCRHVGLAEAGVGTYQPLNTFGV